jgi:ABC-type multidrug transport system fused ATPase/permease subunit
LLTGKRWRLAVVATLSLFDGFAEAALLVMVVRIAVALAADDTQAHMGLGPLPDVSLTLRGMFVVAFGAIAVMVTASTIVAVLGARMSSEALTEARTRLFRSFINASWPVQSMEPEGRLQELMTTHVTRASNGVNLLTGAIVASFSLFALLMSAVIVDAVAAGYAAIGMVCLYFLLRPINRASKRASRVLRDANLQYAGRMSEAVGLAREVQAFHVGEELNAQIADGARALGDHAFRTSLFARMTTTVYQNVALFLVLIGMLGVYAAGLSEVSQLGAVVLLLVRSLSYSTQVQGSIQQAADLAPYLEQLEDQEHLYAENRQRGGSARTQSVEQLVLRDISFSYVAGQPVLHDVCATVERGEAIGIVGPSGSGKSTLVQILLRLRDPQTGAYLIDGVSADEFDLRDWYQRFVFVPQDHRLMLGTVEDNIRFYRPWLSHDDIERAARLAHVHDEIMEWPDGYETVIGLGARDISGGQKQRLALARALATQPSVLVLDEPTSALDVRSARLVQATLKELKGEVTLFIVAHSLGTLSICDRVLVLRQGRVEAFDSPDRLSRIAGFYQDSMQLSGNPQWPESKVASTISAARRTATP